jgi:ferredoxin
MTQSISITIEGIGTIPWKGQASLLDALEEAGIDMNYSCRAGVCGACCAKLVSGQIQWRNQPILTLPKQTILTCSVIPTTDITLALPD